MKKNDGIKKIAQDNVVTTEEACEILKRTRQQLQTYIRHGELEAFKVTSNINLYWRPEVIALSNKINQRTPSYSTVIVGDGYTDRTVKAVKELNINPDDIEEIYVFFEEYDGVSHGFYQLIDELMPNRLIPIEGAHFVVILKNGKEYWFNGVNCGYYGEGPHGTWKILTNWGILSDNVDDFVKYIADVSVLHIIRNGEQFELITEKSEFRQEDEESYGARYDKIRVRLWQYNGSTVLTQQSKYWDLMDTDLMMTFAHFLPEPEFVKFFSKEEAFETGHFSIESGRTTVYQIIIQDRYGKQIWIEYPLERMQIKDNEALKELLIRLGMHIPEEKLIDKIRNWLDSKPKWVGNSYIASYIAEE
ncbi:MAG: hypothetical protein K6G88_11760 [Lachnospiraceae bacterium]|nr:hypothetical protein [Lachnospiraceae bacterium]